jgi:hypothetical protein
MTRLTLASLALTVGLLAVFLCLREADRREIEAHAQIGHGADVVTFRLKLGARQAPRWTPRNLDTLGRLDGVDRVEWQGGTVISQGADTRYVVPLVEVSVGLLDVKSGRNVAGRTLIASDVDRPNVVLGTATARTLFGESPGSAHIGNWVEVGGERFQVVGLVDEVEGAYRAVSSPTDRLGGGRYQVDAVYAVLEPSARAEPVIRSLERFLAQDPGLDELEAVLYREFVAGGVTGERVEFLRESSQLFSLLVALVVVFGAIGLAVNASFAAHRRVERWAVLRTLGASRRALLRIEVAPMTVWALTASIVGAVGGSLLAPHLGGVAAARPLLLALLVGVGAVALGTLPAALLALRLEPAPALRSGKVLRSGAGLVLASSSCLVLAFALVLTAGAVYITGERELRGDLEAIGAGLVRLTPDRGSLLPVAALAPSNLAAVKRQFPGVRMTYVDRMLAGVAHGDDAVDATIVRADEDFAVLSRTPLVEGGWHPDGVVLGGDIAKSLFPEGGAVGSTVRFTGVAASVGELPVVGVALPRSTDRLETLQLSEDSVWIHPTAVPDARSPVARVYIDIEGLEEAEVATIVDALNALSPVAAPLEPVLVAGSYANYLESLNTRKRRFQVAASLLLPLSGIALVQVATFGSESRRRRRAVERVLGADWTDRLVRELMAGVGHLVLIVAGSCLIALAALAIWSAASGNGFAFPTTWALVGTSAIVGFGVLTNFLAARRSTLLTPASEARRE